MTRWSRSSKVSLLLKRTRVTMTSLSPPRLSSDEAQLPLKKLSLKKLTVSQTTKTSSTVYDKPSVARERRRLPRRTGASFGALSFHLARRSSQPVLRADLCSTKRSGESLDSAQIVLRVKACATPPKISAT